MLADTITPVGTYMMLRDKFHGALLLESSDYHSRDDSFSFICLGKIAEYVFDGNRTKVTVKNEVVSRFAIQSREDLLASLQEFQHLFSVEPSAAGLKGQGFYGFMNYDAVSFFETLKTGGKKNSGKQTPLIQYALFHFILVFNHFNNELVILENRLDGKAKHDMDELIRMLNGSSVPPFDFKIHGHESASCTNEQFSKMVADAKQHCQRGDVFQVVLSRRFSQAYSGDDFALYRQLRSINPSPYLFYFDNGNFRLFGSSPELQVMIKNGEASIHPIAGTIRRTGDAQQDLQLADKLAHDPKEKSEHIMLVDLARNDLSRHCTNVEVKKFSEVQFFSHVIHLVSEVKGKLKNENVMWEVVADTFPAGTLSGAPKVRAMQLIEEYEPEQRGYYGGAIGTFGFDGSFNHAIMIRTFLSKNGKLHYQAGAGIVQASDEEKELQEVNNKLGALRKAIALATTQTE
mgnify:CR=1 FL=1